MKTRAHVKLLISAILSMWLISGCADQATKSGSGSMASPEATTAIASANSAIKAAKANNWIWRDTEKILKKAEAAAKKGEEAKAIKLANQARDQANLAVKQYQLEQRVNRGLKPITGMLDTYTVS